MELFKESGDKTFDIKHFTYFPLLALLYARIMSIAQIATSTITTMENHKTISFAVIVHKF